MGTRVVSVLFSAAAPGSKDIIALPGLRQRRAGSSSKQSVGGVKTWSDEGLCHPGQASNNVRPT